MSIINFNVPLNKNSTNANITYKYLDEDTMRNLGFTDRRKGYWYRMKMLTRSISFNISICKDTNVGRIDVLFDDYCQPYDYQIILRDNPQHNTALKVHNEVQNIMKELCINGIIDGYKQNDYI